MAQSTATQVQELIVTGRREAPSTQGLAVQVNEAKDAVVVTQEFIQSQTPSANIAQLIQMVPGVSYSTEDPGGFTSGDLRIHGFDGNHVAVVLDGSPLNDTGNYAVYPGEYMIGELIDRITVNVGSSDVDSPSAAALGASINVRTKLPPMDMGGMLKVTGGSDDYRRLFGEYDTGTIGPYGTRAFVAGEWATEHNYKGRPGKNKRWDISGRIYQPLSGDDFVSIAGIYTSERTYPAFRATAASLATNGGYYFGDNSDWVVPTARTGVVDTIPTNVGPAGADNNYYRLFPNPVEFANIRGQSHFTLSPNLVLTIDPTMYYTIANGGGSTALSEKDKRLVGSSTAAGVDLNADGDVLDTVTAYSASTTTTWRYGVTSSLLYDVNEHNHLQLAYTLDYGRHRQTGEYGYVDQFTGEPGSVFGGRPGYGRAILAADGTPVRGRDRFSVAMLNQISANYIGQFMDDKLHINVGVRAPWLRRELNQFCYTYNGTSAYCNSVSPAAVQAAYNRDVAALAASPTLTSATNLAGVLGVSSISVNSNRLPNFRFPFEDVKKYNKVLPNIGVSYRLADDHLIYASYAKGLAAPKTDNLYTSTEQLVDPEYSDNFAAGYRYQTRLLNFSFNLYDTEYSDRIVSSPDPDDPTLTIDRNVGDVRIRGVDIEAGVNPTDNLHLYASANFNDSKLKDDSLLTTSGIVFYLPTKGNELVLTPKRMFSARASYDLGPVRLGVQGKYMSKRFITDLNDASIPSYTVFSADARYNISENAYVQVNVQNLFDKYYFSRSTTSANGVAYPIPGTTRVYTPSTASYYVGAPRTWTITLGTTF